MNITETEKRVLTSFHLQGCMGKCGSMNKRQRLALLKGLQKKGFLSNECEITTSGIEVAKPTFL